MTTYSVSERAVIAAPPAAVYGTIADYRTGHPSILPKPWFQDLVVERGGVGAGTVIRFTMRVLGTTHRLRATITEPVPGRILVETNDNGSVTTFTVTPAPDNSASEVEIMTELPARSGLAGVLERVATKALLRRIYPRELELLARRHTGSGVSDKRRTTRGTS
jgi:hypothetical protein